MTPTPASSGSNLLSQAFTGSLWLLVDLSLFLSGSLWLSVTPTLALTAILWHTLALSGSLLLSNFACTVLDRLSGPLLGFQRRCHADALSPALPRSNQLVKCSTSKKLPKFALDQYDYETLSLSALRSVIFSICERRNNR